MCYADADCVVVRTGALCVSLSEQDFLLLDLDESVPVFK